MGRDPLSKEALDSERSPVVGSEGSARLIDAHNPALAAADIFMGGFCVLMFALGVWFWWRGEASARTPWAILGFLVANVAISQVSFRSRTPFRIEVGRLVTGGVIAPLAFVLVDGPLGPWWPGFLIMSLGGSIVLGLITENPWFGRGLVAYYLLLFLGSTLVFRPDWPLGQASLAFGVIGMCGLMFAQIMSLLGDSVRKVHFRTVELREARDALFAEMEVAQEIQTLLLPKEPTMPDHEVVGRMIPADEVGGDYYDVIGSLGEDRSLLAIGDVSGHGVTSGLTMMMARSSLVGALEARPDATLADLFRALNRAVFQNLHRMQMSLFMTLTLLEYLGEGRFSAVGRHLPLLLYRHDERRVEEVEVDGTWLGVAHHLDDDDIPSSSFSLRPGDLLVLYTDGIVEHQGDEDMFGIERLKDVIVEAGARGAQPVMDAILETVGGYGEVQDDDMTLMVINYKGAVVAPAA